MHVVSYTPYIFFQILSIDIICNLKMAIASIESFKDTDFMFKLCYLNIEKLHKCATNTSSQ